MTRHFSKRKAVRDALGRLGLHARPQQVVADLSARGVAVSEEMARAVAAEVLREGARAQRQRFEGTRAVLPPAVRRPSKRPPPRSHGR